MRPASVRTSLDRGGIPGSSGIRQQYIFSGAIFGFLPLCVAYSTVKRFGGRPIMGIVIGCIMLTNSLADASAAVVYFTDLAALGFGTTVVPGIALADPAHNGYINYIIAHIIALAAGFLFAFLLGIGFDRKKVAAAPEGERQTEQKPAAPENGIGQQADPGPEKTDGRGEMPEEISAFTSGEFIGIEKVKDPTFAQKVLGDGVAIVPSEGRIYAPCDAAVEMVMDTKHAVGLRTSAGNGLLIHVGIDTVNLEGKYFDVHVSEGQSLKKGDLILDFDREKIAAEGYDISACLL